MSKPAPKIPKIEWDVYLSVKIEGLPLPFRFRSHTTDQHEVMVGLDDFMDMIRLKLYEASE